MSLKSQRIRDVVDAAPLDVVVVADVGFRLGRSLTRVRVRVKLRLSGWGGEISFR